jgi:hypothetical protein
MSDNLGVPPFTRGVSNRNRFVDGHLLPLTYVFLLLASTEFATITRLYIQLLYISL